MENNVSELKFKPYTQKEIDYLSDKIGLLSIKTMAKKLNRTPSSVRSKLDRMRVRFLSTFCGHNYISEVDFIKEIENIPGMTKSIYFSLKECGFIKVNNTARGTNFISIENYDKYIDFFNNYTHPAYFLNVLFPEIPKNTKQQWLTRNKIKRIEINGRRWNKYWIVNSEIKRLRDILDNYIDLKQASKLIGYNPEYIRRLIKHGKIKPKTTVFAKKYLFHRDYLIKELKDYIKRLK